MGSTLADGRMTPAEVEALPDRKSYELYDGELRERVMWVESVWVAGQLQGELSAYADTHGGWSFGSGLGLDLWPEDSRTMLRADFSFVRIGRFPNERLPTDMFLAIPPDIVGEVISPGEAADQIDDKVMRYLDAGVRAVWVVFPLTRRVLIHRATSAIAVFPDGSLLDGGPELPGFGCEVASLWWTPEPGGAAADEGPSGNIS